MESPVDTLGDVKQGVLVERTGLDRTTIGDTLAWLEEEGLVMRGQDLLDRRCKTVAPTDAAAGAMAAGVVAVGRVEERLLRTLGPRQRESLRELLGKTVPRHETALRGLLW